MLLTKFGGNWSSGSVEEEDENVKTLRQRRRRRRQRTNCHQKSSHEPSATLAFFAVWVLCEMCIDFYLKKYLEMLDLCEISFLMVQCTKIELLKVRISLFSRKLTSPI